MEPVGTDKLKITGRLDDPRHYQARDTRCRRTVKTVDDGRGHLHMGVSATGSVNRTDFGMTGYQGMVGNDVELTIDAELVQATKSPAK